MSRDLKFFLTVTFFGSIFLSISGGMGLVYAIAAMKLSVAMGLCLNPMWFLPPFALGYSSTSFLLNKFLRPTFLRVTAATTLRSATLTFLSVPGPKLASRGNGG
jgi:hypothetical protein